MVAGEQELTHRVQQAFDRMHKRVKAIEERSVTRQQLEDLLKLVPLVADLRTRVNRLENSLQLAGESRGNIVENQGFLASEMCFIRERLLTIEGRDLRPDREMVGNDHPAAQAAQRVRDDAS